MNRSIRIPASCPIAPVKLPSNINQPGRWGKKVVQCSPNGKPIQRFTSAQQAAGTYKVSCAAISRALTGKRPSAAGFIWIYDTGEFDVPTVPTKQITPVKRRAGDQTKPYDPAKARKGLYGKAGYNVSDYRFPFGAVVSVFEKGEPVKLLAPYIGGLKYGAVRDRIRTLKQNHPKAAIYITIPSKANLPPRQVG